MSNMDIGSLIDQQIQLITTSITNTDQLIADTVAKIASTQANFTPYNTIPTPAVVDELQAPTPLPDPTPAIKPNPPVTPLPFTNF